MTGVALRRVAVVGLVVIALGLTAGAVDSGTVPSDQGEPRGVLFERNEGTSPPAAPTPGDCVPYATNPLVAGGILLVVTALAAVTYRATRSYALTLAPVGVGGLLLLAGTCGNWYPQGGDVPWQSMLAVAGVAGVGVVVYVLAASTDWRTDDVTDVTEPDLSAVGSAAGRAADRIEAQADVTNEVYRAWREMTAHLPGADDDTTSPGEFAEAAVSAGMASEDVEELTRLFEEVRYGGRDPEAREERALTALRRIEAAYAPADESDGDEEASDA